MKLLKNFDVFNEYYNLNTKEICFFENLQKTIGIYKTNDGVMVALLVEDDSLYFLYGEDEFLMTDSHTVVLKPQSEFQNECSITNGTDLLARFLYPLPDLKLNVSPFEYIDEEDSNWGEFIAKVINDQERKRNFISTLQ